MMPRAGECPRTGAYQLRTHSETALTKRSLLLAGARCRRQAP